MKLIISLLCITIVSCNSNCTLENQQMQCGKLICNTTISQCVKCTTDNQCNSNSKSCIDGQCTLKPLIHNMHGLFILVCFCCLLISALAFTSGCGGGGITMPLLILSSNASLQETISFVLAIDCGQCMSGFLIRMLQHHPIYSKWGYGKRPLINYPYFTLLFPINIIGSILGTIVSRTLPDWLRVALLFIFYLSFSTRGILNIIKQYKKHLEDKSEPKTEILEEIIENNKIIHDNNELNSNNEIIYKNTQSDTINENKEYIPLNVEVSRYPTFPIIMFLLMFIIMSIDSILRRFIFTCGTLYFYLSITISIVLLIILFIIVRTVYKKKQQLIGVTTANPVIPFTWSTKSTVIFPIISVFTGLTSSILGDGGAIITTSMFFDLNFDPHESTATNLISGLFITFFITTIHLISGILTYDYALFFFSIGIFGSIFGKYVIVRFIKKYELNYLIFVFWTLIVIGSLICMTTWGVINTINVVNQKGYLGFNNICD